MWNDNTSKNRNTLTDSKATNKINVPKNENIAEKKIVTEKINRLLSWFKNFDRILVALSGGVDSAVALKAAVAALGPAAVVAVTVRSEITLPEEEETALATARSCGVTHEILRISELSVPEISSNSPQRCYHCKLNRFRLLKQFAASRGIDTVIEGSHQSDLNDYRPGLKALAELGIKSPLMECSFTKEEIREAARILGIPHWEQPANACLATRFPYGVPITLENLSRVARGEKILKSLGFSPCRLRHYGSTARLEIPPSAFPALVASPTRETVITRLQELGYIYVTLDLKGYRSGSLNETLPAELTAEQS